MGIRNISAFTQEGCSYVYDNDEVCGLPESANVHQSPYGHDYED